MDDKRSFRQRCRQPVPYKTPQFTKFACEKHFVEVFKKGGTGEVIASAPTRSVITSSEAPCPLCTGENNEHRKTENQI